MILLLGYTSLIYWTRFSCGYGWLGLHIWQWMIRYCLIFWSTIHLMPYWGIFPFQLRFVDLHGVIWSSSLMRYTPRQWPVCYLIMISQGILSWAIQLGSHFSTFRYHHISSSRRCFFNLLIQFSCGHGWLGLHTWWWIIWCYLIFLIYRTSDGRWPICYLIMIS